MCRLHARTRTGWQSPLRDGPPSKSSCTGPVWPRKSQRRRQVSVDHLCSTTFCQRGFCLWIVGGQWRALNVLTMSPAAQSLRTSCLKERGLGGLRPSHLSWTLGTLSFWGSQSSRVDGQALEAISGDTGTLGYCSAGQAITLAAGHLFSCLPLNSLFG